MKFPTHSIVGVGHPVATHVTTVPLYPRGTIRLEEEEEEVTGAVGYTVVMARGPEDRMGI